MCLCFCYIIYSFATVPNMKCVYETGKFRVKVWRKSGERKRERVGGEDWRRLDEQILLNSMST